MVRGMADLKTRVLADAAELEAEVLELSRRIHRAPELAYQEVAAAGACRELLDRHGFAIEPVAGVETAFVAVRRGARPGPSVGLLAEYDALPGIGHGCGHNLIAGSALGAGLLLGRLMGELGGSVRVYGCPAEEVGTGKPRMLQAGAFDGCDVALTFHAWHTTAVMEQCTGVRKLELAFLGRATHAANDPWVGASALDGVLLTWTAVNALRQFTRDGVRIHGIVTHGGDAFNVIPERATATLAVRSADAAELERVTERVLDCARAAALASATRLEVTGIESIEPVRYNAPLAEVVRANLRALGHEPGTWRAAASTDFGNVSQAIPAVLFSVAAWPTDVAFHTREAAAWAAGEQAQAAMLAGARAMALTAIDLLGDPAVLARVRAGHGAGA